MLLFCCCCLPSYLIGHASPQHSATRLQIVCTGILVFATRSASLDVCLSRPWCCFFSISPTPWSCTPLTTPFFTHVTLSHTRVHAIGQHLMIYCFQEVHASRQCPSISAALLHAIMSRLSTALSSVASSSPVPLFSITKRLPVLPTSERRHGTGIITKQRGREGKPDTARSQQTSVGGKTLSLTLLLLFLPLPSAHNRIIFRPVLVHTLFKPLCPLPHKCWEWFSQHTEEREAIACVCLCGASVRVRD